MAKRTGQVRYCRGSVGDMRFSLLPRCCDDRHRVDANINYCHVSFYLRWCAEESQGRKGGED
ncbi:hypothetical protein O9992_02040 [Vibrio lentus]|nr:hypothetical protein [Vibrio lentus]